MIGNLQNVLLRGVNGSPNSYARTIPSLVYMAFQMKFAVITPALIAGADRRRRAAGIGQLVVAYGFPVPAVVTLAPGGAAMAMDDAGPAGARGHCPALRQRAGICSSGVPHDG